MNTTFTPDAGTFFYAESIIVIERVVGGGLFDLGGTATIHKERDRSYRDDIFLCIGRDDTAVVGVIQTGYRKNDRPKVILPRRNYVFTPVGPEVVTALQLEAAPVSTRDE